MNAVIGTAGHVDHGKSSLIHALTGIHPSHLPQELQREMTIDLGFAHFSTPAGDKIGIIDVPGHERFIRNMVSAVWGLDMVLFVVAADAGWAALSEEHLRIISAMGVKNCILVLSKCDLVDEARLAEVENDALEHFLCEMDILPEVIHVSAHTGQGIDALKELVTQRVKGIDKREDLDTQTHLYVDRVFSVNGVGTTVTGTLRGAELKEGDTLTMFPGGQTVKVRSLQGYHKQLDVSPPYSRTAVGLKQVNKKLLSRGSCLVANADAISVSTDWIIQLNPQFSSMLKKQSIIEVALGTAHTRAKCFVYAEGQLARLQLEEPIPAFWGQPVLLIQHGGSQIIGSGRLVWVQPLDRKMRQVLQETLPKIVIKSADITSKITLQLALDGYAHQVKGINQPEQVACLGEWWIREESLQQLHQKCDELLNKAVNALGLEDLARSTGYPSSLVEVLVAQECASERWQKIEGGIVSAQSRQSGTLPADQQRLLDEIQNAGAQGFEAAKSSIAGIKPLLRALTERKLIVPTEDNLFFTSDVYDDIVKKVMIGRNVGDTFTVADAREATELARKQLIPIFNRMERDGWVKRVGNDRKVCRLYKDSE